MTVAVAVSSVVHLAARRAVQAAQAREEAASLLELAQTVLGGADSPAAVLDHLTRTHGGQAELQERVGGRWVRAASSGVDGSLPAASRASTSAATWPCWSPGRRNRPRRRLMAGYAAQAAAALDRERLRTQAAQAEALAEGNRMRTALLAAVSHDLRTPLASIKASVSSLRQTDVEWSEADQADLLATIEQNADRLDALIGNLLDMSRLHTGSLQPFLRPDRDRRSGAGRPARAGRLAAARDGRARRVPAGAGRSRACWSGCWPTCSPMPCGTPRPGGRPSCARGWPTTWCVLEVVDHGHGRARRG